LRPSRTIFFFLICITLSLLSGRSALGAITLTPTVTPISAETYNGSLQFIYDGVITAIAGGGTAPYTYTLAGPFSTSAAVNNPYFPGLGPGTYTLTVTDATGQTASTTLTMGFLYAQPSLTVSSIVQPSLCRTTDGGFTLNASGGTPPYTYSIDGGNNYVTNSTFTNLSGGIYYVSAKDTRGQIGIVGSNPTSATGGVIALSAPFCMLNPGISASLNTCGNGGNMNISVYSTSPPINFSLDGLNYWSLPLNPAFPNTYRYDTTGLAPGLYNTVTTDFTGNITRFAMCIAKSCIPDLSVFAQGATCHHSDGIIIALAANSSPPYSYTLDGVNYQISSRFTGLSYGYYNVLVKDGAGVTSNATVLVGGGCPVVTATATAATCNLNDGSITATAGQGFPTYQWSIDGVNFQVTNIFTGVKSGNYTVTIRDMMGQTGTCTVTVPNNCISVSAAVVDSKCDNNSGSITATAGGGGTPPYKYSIDGTNFQTSNLFSGLGAGIYTLTIQDPTTLEGTSTATVAIDSNLTVDAGSDLTICDGASATLGAVSNGAGFSWLPTAGLDNPTALSPRASPQTTTKYFLTATLGVCSHTDSVLVNVNPAPVADAGNDTSICSGQSVQLGGSGGQGYQWTPSTNLDQPASADPNVTRPPSSITYHLVVTGVNSCPSINDAQVTVTVTPPPKVFAGQDTTVLTGESILLHASDVNNSGFNSYSWTPATGLSNPSIPNPVATPQQTTTYTVLAETADGCEGSAGVTLKVFTRIGIFVPNAFTPNGDGHNDILRAVPLGIKTFHYFSVFNRTGQRIFFTANPSEGWDGSFNGQLQNTGVYVWIAAGIDLNGHLIQRNGTVTLIR
jgi:gliding motility-associated-like protein